MAQCPVCDAPVTGDFGLVECEGCGVQLLVHVDGRVEYQGAEAKQVLGESVEPSYEAPPTPPAEAAQLESSPEPFLNLDEQLGRDGGEDYSFEESTDPLAEPAPIYKSAVSPDSPDLSDLANFGNSDISGSKDGALRYTVFIQGIDTADLRAAFREAITDKKFVWDIDQILRSVRGGEVTIQNVTASKAYILIARLRSLPLRIKWEQYAIHQA